MYYVLAIQLIVLYLCQINEIVTNKKFRIMKTENKIISRRELAIRLSNGPVNTQLLSKRVEKTVNLWLNRKEVVIENGFLKLA